MDKLLERQIRKYLKDLDSFSLDDRTRLMVLFSAISDTYKGFDKDRLLMERSLELSSKELKERHETLQKDSKEQRELLASIRDIISTLEKARDGGKATEPAVNKLTKEYLVETLNNVVSERIEIETASKKQTADLEKMNKFMVGRELKMAELKKRIKELEAGQVQ